MKRIAVKQRRGILLILVVYLVLAIAYGVTIPPFETPDARGHYSYIHELTSGRGLPVQGTPSGERVTGYIASHPPVYYVLSAAVTFWISSEEFNDWAWRNPLHANGYPHSVHNKNYLIHTEREDFPWGGIILVVHIARFVSAVLGGVTVLATYLIAQELFPERRWLAWGAAALTAFNPMFVFAGARVSNDAAVACFGGLTLWGATRLAVRGLSRRGLILTGLAWGLAVLSKLSGTTLGPALALALLLDARARGSESANQRVSESASHSARFTPYVLRFTQYVLRNSLLLFGTSLLVAGWWFVRNLALYDELMGVNAWLSHTGTVRPEPIGFFDVIAQLEGLEWSYWAIFGWFNIAVEDWVYRLLWWLVRLALVGLAVLIAEQFTRRRLPRPAQWGLLVLATGFLFAFGSVWRFIMIVLGAQGRYLILVVAAISLFLYLGLSHLVTRRLERALTVVLSLGLCVFSVTALVGAILPAYAKPATVTEMDLPDDLTRFGVRLGDTPVELIGGRVHDRSAYPGDWVTVDVYWRAAAPVEENYLAYVHLLGKDLTPVGKFDGYPGGGNFPASLWEPGQIYRDRYRIPIDGEASVPTMVRLSAGLRDGEDWLTPVSDQGDPWPGMLLLDVFALRSKARPNLDGMDLFDAGLQNPSGTEKISLIGYDLSAFEIRPSAPLTLTLAWRADFAIERPYTVFAHLRDRENRAVVQADGPPRGGNYLTTFWAEGEVVVDQRVLELPEDLPPGRYRLVVGLYYLETGQRLLLPDGSSEVLLPQEVTVQ